MAYATYTTDALVCGSFEKQTADRSYLLFTRDAGMVYADAKSVREERSRQRYSLQDFSSIRVSLVKGKGGWRIGSIEPLENHYHLAVDKAARGSVVSVVRFLRRFAGAEEASPSMFDEVLLGLRTLRTDVPARSFAEHALFVRLLAQLGYVDQNHIPAAIRQTPLRTLVDQADPTSEAVLGRLYTQAITVSHL
jgi:recombinational DNA repair protein (RecF pathway)